MKLSSYKSVFSRRRFLIYVVLLLTCFLINYGFLSSFLRITFDRLRNVDRAVEYSEEAAKILRSNIDSIVSKKITKVNVNGQEAEVVTNDIMTSITNLKEAAVQKNNIGSQDTKTYSNIDIISSDILKTMTNSSGNFEEHIYRTCNNRSVIGNSCVVGDCLQLQLPDDLRTRVEQVVTPTRLQINYNLRKILTIMADKVPGYYDFILVSGVSSSHFNEAQAMLYNIHTNLFPYLTNFTFIYYNLGLSGEQRRFMAKICRCHLIDFPFHLFPEFVSFLKCYAWKPFIVNAHITRANLLYWIDASVRFRNNSLKTVQLLNKARVIGLQLFKSKQSIAHVTLPSMFHFFGDEACVYGNYSVILSGVVLFRNVHFVRRAILEPWAACAINSKCMCPQNVDLHDVRLSCHSNMGLYHYGVCHRFDQSALSLILVKLYKERISHILSPIKDYLDIKRDDRIVYPIELMDSQNLHVM